MPEKWTEQLIGRMHNYRVTYDDLSKKMNISKGYINQSEARAWLNASDMSDAMKDAFWAASSSSWKSSR